MLDHVREQAKGLVETRFGGNVLKAAVEVGISQSQLSDFLNRKKGLGLPVVLAIADYLHCTLDELLGRDPFSGNRTLSQNAELAAAVDFLAATYPREYLEQQAQVYAKEKTFRSRMEYVSRLQADYVHWSQSRKPRGVLQSSH